MAYDNIAVALLAAGQGKRFGGDKLLADLGGSPLGLHAATTLSNIGFGWRFAICGSSIAKPLAEMGFQIVLNDDPDGGQSRSLHLAVVAAQATDASALLVCLADMPFVKATHVHALVAEGDHINGIIASTNGANAMPPALFPRAYWPDLLNAKGDSGARAFLPQAKLVLAPPETLIDIDTPQDLAGAAARL